MHEPNSGGPGKRPPLRLDDAHRADPFRRVVRVAVFRGNIEVADDEMFMIARFGAQPRTERGQSAQRAFVFLGGDGRGVRHLVTTATFMKLAMREVGVSKLALTALAPRWGAACEPREHRRQPYAPRVEIPRGDAHRHQ
jgi:hypothetical protein